MFMPSTRSLTSALAVLFMAPAIQSGSAQTFQTWTGASSADFLTNANWNAAAPNSTQVGLFQGTAGAVPFMPTLAGAKTVNGLAFTSAAGGWTLGSSSGTLSIASGTSSSLYGISTIGQTSGTNTIDAAIVTGVAASSNTQNWSVGTGGTLIINGNVNSVAGSILQIGTSSTGAGTLIMNGVNSRTGETRLMAGTTIYTQNNTGTGLTTIDSGATLQLGNGSTTGSLAATANGLVVNTGGVLAIKHSDNITINTQTNALSGGGLIKNTGTGTTSFTGTSSFTGDLQVSSGQVNVSQLNALGGSANTGKVTVDSGARLLYGSSNLTRSGDVVNDGTLILFTATQLNGITFASGKTVSGNGVFQVANVKTGVADFTFAGTVAPGAAPGEAGSFTMGDGAVATTTQFMNTSTIVWNLTGTGGVAGSDYDTFKLMGGSSVSLASGAQLQIALSGINFDGSAAYWQASHTYSLFSTSDVAGTLALLDNVYSDSYGTGTFTVSGQNINYTFAPVPEPSTLCLMAAGGAFVLARARRRIRAQV